MPLLHRASAFTRILPYIAGTAEGTSALVYALAAILNLCERVEYLKEIARIGVLPRLQVLSKSGSAELAGLADDCLSNMRQLTRKAAALENFTLRPKRAFSEESAAVTIQQRMRARWAAASATLVDVKTLLDWDTDKMAAWVGEPAAGELQRLAEAIEGAEGDAASRLCAHLRRQGVVEKLLAHLDGDPAVPSEAATSSLFILSNLASSEYDALGQVPTASLKPVS